MNPILANEYCLILVQIIRRVVKWSQESDTFKFIDSWKTVFAEQSQRTSICCIAFFEVNIIIFSDTKKSSSMYDFSKTQ